MKGCVGTNLTGFIGVNKYADHRFGACIKIDNIRCFIGSFPTAEEAARAYDRIAIWFRNEDEQPYLHTNFPIDSYLWEEIAGNPRLQSILNWLRFNGYTNGRKK